ncbi:hypothetical protein [Nocardia sp. CA-290969]|uniref:hypothetical protein n=1 Tax=Nocardia sp. CA-290969 TaxID=3239986 RepID=UPI003D8C992B
MQRTDARQTPEGFTATRNSPASVRSRMLDRRMTLPRKGIRNIVVDGERYRWVVSGIDAPIRMDLIVERAGGRSSRLIVGTEGPVVITPALVARIVTAAVQGGWAPHERGKDFRCHLYEDSLIPYRPSERAAAVQALLLGSHPVPG